jgi:hypothetical protein
VIGATATPLVGDPVTAQRTAVVIVTAVAIMAQVAAMVAIVRETPIATVVAIVRETPIAVVAIVRETPIAVVATAVEVISTALGIELLGGLFHPPDIVLLLVDGAALPLGLHPELVGLGGLRTGLLLGCARPVLLLADDRVLLLELLLAFSCAAPQFRGLGELLPVAALDGHRDERDHDDQRDHPDDDPDDGVHSCLPFRGRVASGT